MEGSKLIDQKSIAVALLIVAAGLVALIQLDRVRFPIKNVSATAEGVFVEHGAVPEGRSKAARKHYWSSWVGTDENRGRLTIGPFPAPPVLGFEALGYPRMEANRLYLENVATGETWDPQVENLAGIWRLIQVEIPRAWRGKPMVIRAVDESVGWGGWFAVGNPYSVPKWISWQHGPPSRLFVFLLIGTAMFIHSLGAMALCRRLGLTNDSVILLLSLGISALAGYLVFWVFFLNNVLGFVVAWLELVTAAVVGVRAGSEFSARSILYRPDWWMPVALMVGAGVFYFAGLHMFSVESPMSDMTQLRFTDGLPADNTIPQVFARRLMHGLSPRNLLGEEWLSSDRPPLQAGWTLFLTQPALASGVIFDTAAQCAGIWFQLIWIPAVWVWLRNAGVRACHVALITAAIVPTGFLFLNTVFVWPKLGAGAFVLGAFTLWFVIRDEQMPRRFRFVAGGILAALGWLSHEGVSFAFLALLPLILWKWRNARSLWWTAAAGFALCILPWIAYQRFYEPPGNRLIKWHLAGVIEPNDRGTIETLVESYSKTPLDELLRNRWSNLRLLVHGDWRQIATFDVSNAHGRRYGESFMFFSALGWWDLGFVAFALTAVIPWVRKRWTEGSLPHIAAALVWCFGTLAVWVALMFIGNTTLTHQGSYTTLLVLYPALALALFRLHPAVFALVAAAQIGIFPFIWLTPPPHWASLPWNSSGIVLIVVAFLSILAVVATALYLDRTDR